jgi:hypothetical protein
MDPTDERVPVARQLAPREVVLKGTVALLDIRKPRGDVLLNRIEELLKHISSSVGRIRVLGLRYRRQFADTVFSLHGK